MWRAIASNFLTLAIVALVAVGGVIAWGQRQYVEPGPLAQAICLQVAPGSTMRRVSADLEEDGAIASGYIFRVGADYEDKTGQLKAGSFLIAPGASMQGIVDTVTRGGQSTCGTEINYRIGVLSAEMVVRELDPATNRYVERVAFDPAADPAPPEYLEVAEDGDTRLRVTLAEGATAWQVVEALKRADFLEGEIDTVPAEGTLAPDSYEVRRGGSRADLVAEMERRQTAILADAWANRAQDLPYDTPEQALVMASLVEKETGIATERGRVASVFVNRLEKGMRLQTDPAVIYGVTKGQGALGRGLRQSELRRATPYNTYVIDGLPPGPIANPGRDAIRAATNPDRSDFLFFVADGSGGHAFARTLDEHNQNVRKWREIEAQRGEQDQGGTQTGSQTGN
ncbi:endolytic transglycosylase MltG [Frigidibacter sp. MR17.24]|uniref:endolytic transglycosylase MltG n=1 Tax=Frigidibacter sp. MR17.24 TaxID=3127345 RepID=UPI003012D148